MRDKWSKMSAVALREEIRKITMVCNGGKGLTVPQSWQYATDGDEWVERQMRELLRFLYDNLKETYIAKVMIMDGLEKEQKKEGEI